MVRKVSLVATTLSILALNGCETVNTDTVADMPTGYLCDLLSDNYITLPSERRAVYHELEKRDAECVDTEEIRIRVIEDEKSGYE